MPAGALFGGRWRTHGGTAELPRTSEERSANSEQPGGAPCGKTRVVFLDG